MSETPDPLDELLRPHWPPDLSSTWKERLLARTKRRLRWRRRGRQLSFVTALAACYGAGILTIRVFPVEHVVEVRTEYVYVPAEPDKEVAKAPEVPPTPEQPVTAIGLEWQAFDNPERSAELFRRAGDRYLDEEHDMESAIRSYKQFLADCPESDPEIAANDNWLLVTLKNARLEEKKHAKHRG